MRTGRSYGAAFFIAITQAIYLTKQINHNI
jgi:hypothetical protein